MKIKYGPVSLVYLIPITLVGALVEGKPNYTTIGDCGLMGIKPPLVYVSSHIDHHINSGILENKAYSINIPNTKLLAKADYCGMVSGKDLDKSVLFNTFFGELGNVPMIKECPVCLECKVIKEFSIQHRQVFIGEVVQTHIDNEYLTGKEEQMVLADLKKLDPIIYALDNNYYKIGEIIGMGYKEGLKINNK